jgi:hypothetical protein
MKDMNMFEKIRLSQMDVEIYIYKQELNVQMSTVHEFVHKTIENISSM